MPSNTNLIEETLSFLRKCGKCENDIYYVRVKDIRFGDIVHYVDWDSFKDSIKDFTYDKGYGLQYIWKNLRIVLRNGEYIRRQEYDGSEWWEYISKPPMDVLITKYDPGEMDFKEWYPTPKEGV